MSKFFPHTPYAEDQPLYHTILTQHVLTRGLTAGSVVGLGIFGGQQLYSALGKTGPTATPAAASAAASTLPLPATIRLLRTAGTSSAVFLALMAVALPARMWGREEIEWRDRSWRLLENQGQMQTDDWTVVGMAAGLGFAAVRKGGTPLGWRGVLGSVGVGSVLGTVGYLGWKGMGGGGEKVEMP